jgi:hypothetical protein
MTEVGCDIVSTQINRLNNDYHPHKPFEAVIKVKPWIEGFKGIDVIKLAVNPLKLGHGKLDQATELISYEHEE